MKAKDILEWICRESINGDYLNVVDVPEEGENEWEQNEEWWYNHFGMCPPFPVVSGKYLYFYASQVFPNVYDSNGCECDADAQIELPNEDNMWGYDYINLYKLED